MKRETHSSMMQYTNLYAEASRRRLELQSQIEATEKALSAAPVGKIHILTSKRGTQFYLRTDSKDRSGKYIRKKNRDVIKRYLQKSYNEKVLKVLKSEFQNLNTFLKEANQSIHQLQSIYSDYSKEIKQHIEPVEMSDEDFCAAWMEEVFQGKEIEESLPFYETDKGERVRSKSELTIANALAKHRIPYKYECPLELKSGRTIYPDFTVLNVKKRKVIYWEHRGMMDDMDYAKHTVDRVKTLMKNGILLGDSLVITEETSTSPLGTNEIEAVIRQYFM